MTPRVLLYIREAAEKHDTSLGDILGRTHLPKADAARAEVMCRLFNDGFKSSQIGHWLRRHDSTVRHVVRRHVKGIRKL